MFKINPAPTFSVPVKLTVPGDKNTSEITVTFKHLNAEEYNDWLGIGPDGQVTQAGRERTDEVLLLAVMKDWAGVDVEFSADNLRLLLSNYLTAGQELFGAYVKARKESQVKN